MTIGVGSSSSSSIYLHSDPEKKSRVGESALAALSSQITSNKRISYSQNLEKVMRLESKALDLTISLSPSENWKLDLKPQERALIDQFCTSWSLYQKISLMELWGLETYKALQQLKTYMHDEGVMTDFLAQFIRGYVSLVMEANLESQKVQRPTLFFEREQPQSGVRFFSTRKEWVFCLDDTIDSARRLLDKKIKISAINKLFQEVEKRLKLGQRLLEDSNAIFFLTQYNLGSHRVHFPKAPLLDGDDPKKTIEDLILYVDFINKAFEAGMEKKKIGINTNFLPLFHQSLIVFSKSKNKLKGVRVLKNELGEAFYTLQETFERFNAASKLTAVGLDHAGLCTFLGMKADGNKTSDELNAMLALNQTTLSLANSFVTDFLKILDAQVMEKLYPDNFVGTDTCFARYVITIQHFLYIFDTSFAVFPKSEGINPANSLLPAQAQQLEKILSEVTQETTSQVWLLLKHLAYLFDNAPDLISQIDASGIVHATWYAVLKELNLTHFDEGLIRLDATRKKYLAVIETFLASLGVSDLLASRTQWENFFKEKFFLISLDFFRLSILYQDAKRLLRLNVVLTGDFIDEDLLSDQLLDFMELEGIEDIFDRLLQPAPIVSEFIQSEASPAIEEVISLTPVKEKVQPSHTLSEKLIIPIKPVDDQSFKIRRGEKVRKILARLRGLGIMPTKDKRAGTSHLKLEDPEGKTSTIIPIHKDLKKGTAKSIALQVNQALKH